MSKKLMSRFIGMCTSVLFFIALTSSGFTCHGLTYQPDVPISLLEDTEG